MKRKQRRMMVLGLCLLGVGTATGLALTAFEENILFFYGPTDIATQGVPEDTRFRLGGLVAEDSVRRLRDGISTEFLVTDTVHDVRVVYTGILPDLFREGQGVVTHGRLDAAGLFVADEVLARHDEEYMPPEVAEALERAGHGPLTAPAAAGRDAVGYASYGVETVTN